jgi:hypothetical protein
MLRVILITVIVRVWGDVRVGADEVRNLKIEPPFYTLQSSVLMESLN